MNGIPNRYQEPRDESQGETRQRWAGHLIKLCMLFGVRFHPHEHEAVAVAMGAVVRFWNQRRAKQ
ncbi:MAG: hypothetical protein ACRECF_04430 [Methyloceanibacter sp.]